MNRLATRLRHAVVALCLPLVVGGCGSGDESFSAQQVQQIDAAVSNGLAQFGGPTPVPRAMVAVFAPGMAS